MAAAEWQAAHPRLFERLALGWPRSVTHLCASEGRLDSRARFRCNLEHERTRQPQPHSLSRLLFRVLFLCGHASPHRPVPVDRGAGVARAGAVAAAISTCETASGGVLDLVDSPTGGIGAG